MNNQNIIKKKKMGLQNKSHQVNKARKSTNSINTVKARLGSNGDNYVEYTSNNKYFRNAVELLNVIAIVLEVIRKIMLIFKGK